MRVVMAVIAAMLVVVVAPLAFAAEPLAWKLKENERFYLEYKPRTEMRCPENNGELKAFVETYTLVLRCTVVKCRPEGGFVLDLCLESYLADDPLKPKPRLIEQLQGRSFRFEVDGAMNVVSVGGLDELLRDSGVIPSHPQHPHVRRVVHNLLTLLLQQPLIALPNRPTQRGDQWEQETQNYLSLIGWLVRRRTFTDEGEEVSEGRALRKIRVSGTASIKTADWDVSAAPMRPADVTLKHTRYEGLYRYDPALGRIVDASLNWQDVTAFTMVFKDRSTPGECVESVATTIRILDHNPLIAPRPKPDPRTMLPPMPPVANTLGMQFVAIRPGRFLMGSPDNEPSRAADESEREIEISQRFYMGVHEVTVGQFRKFVEDTGYKTAAESDGLESFGWNAAEQKGELGTQYNWKNPGHSQTDNHPVVLLTWHDACAFCEWLSKKENRVYRLPTEAEWEYTCRAGTNTRYHSGDEAESVSAFDNVGDRCLKQVCERFVCIDVPDGHVTPAPVGSYKPNAWGLHDTHGNVSEWCADWYWAYDRRQMKDPKGANLSMTKVARGGCWMSVPASCRSAARGHLPASFRISGLGFRVVCENPKP